MPDVKDAGFVVSANVDDLVKVALSLSDGLALIEIMGKEVRKATYLAQAQAVLNVSGVNVTYSGGTFVVNRQTGNLSRSIGTTFPNILAGLVKASADYADAVEAGHKAIDLKKTMMGKVIPLPVPQGTPGSKLIAVENGGGATSAYINVIFRKVGSTGWIIPATKPRPFMQAAGEAIQPQFEADLIAAIQKYIEEL